MISIDYLRSFRLGDYAIFDFAASFILLFLLAPLLSWLFAWLGLSIPRRTWLYWTLPIGIMAHILVGRITPMTQYFLDPNGHYVLKVLMVGLVVLGLLGVRRG